MKSSDIRLKFIEFFAQRDHLLLPSFSLIPKNDASLLLIGAGMAPLKPYFSGQETPPHKRLVTCQKCVRTPDIDRVGKTARHATFFEMLGNFSFGDYFKEEAISWAWEFVTGVLGLPPERLYISIYRDDEESYGIWKDLIGIPPAKITRLDKTDNFWEIGPGPCGPCSEIYFDLGEERGCGRPDCKVGCDCDRYLEIWNLVFTQYFREEDGKYTPLKQKNIDTGAGLERLAVVMQGAKDIFQIDTVKPLLDFYCGKSGVDFGRDPRHDLSVKIITEHFRGVAFMVADGILPSNEGRGYVLRRLLRRALRHGKLLGLKESFLHKGIPLLVELMSGNYPELKQRQDYIVEVIKREEERFLETLDQGNRILEDEINNIINKKDRMLSGKTAFKLYDTFGFPLDLTKEILSEMNCTVDESEFFASMEEQRTIARLAQAKKTDKGTEPKLYKELQGYNTVFKGYEVCSTDSKILGVLSNNKKVNEAAAGTEVELILDVTPFYAEKGGQVGDKGTIEGDGLRIAVVDTVMTSTGLVIHKGTVEMGPVREGQAVVASIAESIRRQTAAHHTATHLLHQALRDVLDVHVAQAGSMVSPERLRFDFSHFAPLDASEIEAVEAKVNEVIWQNVPVAVEETTYQEAVKRGTLAFFEDKYEDKVREIKVGDYSRELCGGTHVSHTGEIGLFKIYSESGIGAGLRRIEAYAGEAAYKYLTEKTRDLLQAAEQLKVKPEDVPSKLLEITNDLKETQKKVQHLADRLAAKEVDELIKEVIQEKGISILSAQVQVNSIEQLRLMADQLKNKLGSGIIVLGTSLDGKVQLVAAVTKDLIEKGFHAGKIVREVAMMTGGSGGGRPDMAQAGGKDNSKLTEALQKVKGMVR